MKKAWIYGVWLCVSSLSVANASETRIQLDKVSCRDFLLAETDEVDLINIFHLGYLAGSQKKTVIDIEQMSQLSANVKVYCVDNPEALLIDTFTKVSKQQG
jgi:hypothetical protein